MSTGKMAACSLTFEMLHVFVIFVTIFVAVYGNPVVNDTIPDSNTCQYTFVVPETVDRPCTTTAMSTETALMLENLKEEFRGQNKRLNQLESRLTQAEAVMLRQSNVINERLADVMVQVEKNVCSAPWIKYRDSCYWFAQKGQATSWKNARLFCQVMSCKADLAVINDSDEMAMIEAYVDVLDSTNSWWLGCTNAKDNKWSCIDNTSLTFTNWSPGHPSRRSNRCIHMWRLNNQAWNDAHCNQDWAFICEQKPNLKCEPGET
ncbi:polycystin-1-like protein 2 isoform X2 [Glandiceps talaboti]